MDISSDPSASAPDASISPTAALTYWSSVPADNQGMLGGYASISRIDLQSSANFIAKLKKRSHLPLKKKFARVVDCGAGIGRITSGLLVNVAEVVDVVEPVGKFTREIMEGKVCGGLREEGRIGTVWTVGLEGWDPVAAGVEYDVIWNQWCLGQLKDEQLVGYLKRCTGALAEGGWIIVKENLTTSGDEADVFDETDSSVTRSDGKFRVLFERAGLKIVATELQRGFPKDLGLFPVRTYALRP